MDRRALLRMGGVLLFGSASSPLPTARSAPREKTPIAIGFSTYGLPGMPAADAVETLAGIGYEAVELAALPGQAADPARLDDAARLRLRKTLIDRAITLAGVMVETSPLARGAAAENGMKLLESAAGLARSLTPTGAPLPPLETVLGGKPEQWDSLKNEMVGGLKRWAAWAEPAGVVIAIKAHVGGACHLPEHAEFLRSAVNSRAIKLAFDQSHFGLRGVALDHALDIMMPHTVFIHVKDYVGTAAKFQFALPGATNFDYVNYFRALTRRGFRGSVVVEVSRQLWARPGYDALAAARSCWNALSTARAAALA